MSVFGGVYSGLKVLVTGHTGFKGSWLCEWLLALGADVAGYSLYIPSDPAHFDLLRLKGRVKDFRGDVRDAKTLADVVKEVDPDIVFHLAAQSIVRTAYKKAAFTFETNLMGTINLLEAISSVGSTRAAVFITSDKCYENVEWNYGYRETDRLGGKDPYSASKACAEIAISSYGRSLFDPEEGSPLISSTRAGNVIGGGDWGAERIVPDCVTAWSQGNDLLVRSPGSTRPWQHVMEPLSGYLRLGQLLLDGKKHLHTSAFNFGPDSGSNHSVSYLIDEMSKTWKGNSWFTDKPDSENMKEAALLKLCCDEALARLNWSPTLTFGEGVKMTTLWYEKFYSGSDCDVAELTSSQIEEYVNLARQRGAIWTG